MARNLTHPSLKDITVDNILYALSDSTRRNIIKKLLSCSGMSCTDACDEPMSPSTISFHHKILRENGLIRSEKKGVSVINTVRKEDIEKKFPGLLEKILHFD